jgi:hypothetical protein
MAATRQTLTLVRSPGTGQSGGSIVALPEGTSETFKKGALVAYDLSENGIVEVGRSSGVPTIESCFGIALEDASGTAAADVEILIPSADAEFVCAVATDADTMLAPALDMLGAAVGIVKLSTTGGAGTEYVAVYAATFDESDLEWARCVRFYGPDVEKRGGYAATFTAGDRIVIRFGARAFMGVGVDDQTGQEA